MPRTLDIELHAGQAAIWNSPARFIVVAAGRRFGKSHLAAKRLATSVLETTNYLGKPLGVEQPVYYVAPTFDQAKRIMLPKLQETLGYANRNGFITRENINEGWIEVINKRRIYIKGADKPDSLRGIGPSDLVMDEYADMREGVWTMILRPSLMDVRGKALFIGTPKGKNHFYKLFMTALHYESDPTSDDIPLYEAFSFKSLDNPHIDPNELDLLMDVENTPLEVVKQELEASFISSGSGELSPGNFPIIPRLPDIGDNVQTIVTVDLAGFSTDKKRNTKLDESVICTVAVTPESWYVLDMQHGRWDVRETALRIVKTCDTYRGCMLGIEKGALMNAVEPYLVDYMREFNRYFTPYHLNHGNQAKASRIKWALQGRSERSKIKLVKGEWNDWLLEQIGDFPDPLCHDDGIDALAYVDQLASVSYVNITQDIDEWECLDLDSGY